MEQNLSFIPVAYPKAKLEELSTEIFTAVKAVLSGGHYILGNEINQFEKEFAEYLGVKYSIGVANGTDAIALALKAVGLKPGDEVITVSHSAVATVAAIEMIGAVPVFVDIDIATRCMNPELLPLLISSKTKALLPVHIYGQPAPMNEIKEIARKYELKIVEDCAQSHGAEIDGKKVGSFGDAASFSFYPTKNLGTFGDGGAVVTNSDETADYLKAARQYGWCERYISSFPGINSRLDEIHACILRILLKKLDTDNTKRIKIAYSYDSAADGITIKTPARIEKTKHVYHLYVIETDDRDEFSEFLKSKGIGTAVHYPMPIHLQPAYSGRIRGEKDLPVTENLYKKIVTLPMFPELPEQDVERVVKALKNWPSEKILRTK